MTGHRPFAELREKMPPARRKAANERVASLQAEMPLAERQQAIQLIQQSSATTRAVIPNAIAEPENGATGSNRQIAAVAASVELSLVTG